MKKIILLLFLTLLSINIFAFSITKNGKALSSVILEKDATEAEKYACKEFVNYIKVISGTELQVFDTPQKGNNIFIGQTETVKKELGDIFSSQPVINEKVIIKTKGNNLFLTGDREKGTAYAVYTFLEEYLGCRFLTPKEEFIPNKSTIEIKNIDYSYTSPFAYRENYWRMNNWIYQFHCLKIKDNGSNSNLGPEMGSKIERNLCHSFATFLPIEKYGTEHPEWFCEREGKRATGPLNQPCLTNKEMVKEFTKNVLKYLDENPLTNVVSVTQNDNIFYCTCDKCKEFTDQYGQSGLMLSFVNQIADAVREKYPNVFLETFAYQYTQKPPTGNIVPRDNVMVQLCAIDCDYSKPLNSPSNADFYNDFMMWSKICPNLSFWDYNANFGNYIIIHPNTHILKTNIDLLYKNNVKSVFLEGDFENDRSCFSEYKRYILSKLLWNPNLNFEKETKDFFKYYYGPAADEMYKFMKSSENAVKRDDVRLPVFSYDNNYYSAKDWEEGLKHLKKALILADTDNYLKHGSFYAPHLENGYGGVLNEDLKEIKPDYYDHVRFEFMCYYAGLMTAKKEVYNELKNKNILPYKTKKDYLSEMTEYLSARGVKRADASNSFDNSMYQIREGKKEGTVPDICKNLQDDEWYDIQEKSMFLGIDLPQYRKTVEDPKASNGKAIWMNPKHIDWYVQTKLDYMFINEKFDKGDIYITYRIEPGEEQGEAFKAGLYDGESQFLFEYSIINDGNTEYKTEKIGSVDFANTKTGALVWLSGAGMENTAKCMYLDRIFVILK